jgi:hypothetical protein
VDLQLVRAMAAARVSSRGVDLFISVVFQRKIPRN